MNILSASFTVSAHSIGQLPVENFPEVAFAGRSNVGKSSLLNAVFNRRNLVKVSSKPGKTQGLNFFLVDEQWYFVDLPGYGYAKVSKSLKSEWGKLITAYLENRPQLRCVVVIMDLRHEAKPQDGELLLWLRQKGIPILAVYTKADKLSGNERARNARILDAGHGLTSKDRIIFSALSKLGSRELVERLTQIITDQLSS